MGHVDTADRILTMAFNQKEKFMLGDTSLDYEFASLDIKSKLAGIERDLNFVSRNIEDANINYGMLKKMFSKVNESLDYWSTKKENTANLLEDVQFSLLRVKTQAIEMGLVRDYAANNLSDPESSKNKYLSLVNEIYKIETKISSV